MIRSSDAPSIAITVTRPLTSGRARSNDTSIDRASSSGGTPRPRSASSAAIDDSTITTNSGAQTARACGALRRRIAVNTHRIAAADSTIVLASSALAVAASSTSENVTRLRHIRVAPAAAAIAPSHVSTFTLSHAGENTSRASSCHTTSRM